MLTKDQVEHYRVKGYLGVEGVFSATEVAELGSVTDEFVEQSRQVTEHTDVFDLEPDHTPEFPKLRRLKSPVQSHEVYKRALHNDRVLDIVAELVGSQGIRYNGNKLNIKGAESGSPVEWHQDWAFYPHTNDDLLAVGVCIDEMTEANGCLLVIPGSHRGPILDHHQDGHFIGAVTDPEFDDSTAEKVELPAGSISIHHVRVLHGSLPNRSPTPRRLLLFQYCCEDSWPLLGSDWDSYCNGYLRGDPCNRPRVTDVPVQLAMPTALKGGSIYETQTDLKTSTFKHAAEAN
ncbi:MAG TPA: phytanoyl-CoA dioxygenase family protein [Candidatus Latescibacteria bacterium]|jgi:ectoine hydroxylase-related dioxygenase (phytanoyl-CoA dioxygenase family)|nr:phytanoyl-CoA dioxygenase [Gemmatimonadaceae bacterium]MDP6017396.1 phytanoyl-CoA dioxygenase family protein [Candidatus Latescibacterota bacterium]HJP30215.1 phytanoyl-CoA dioxygenase family protein [Candidatus Latescibacterota bacterium]|tara:strand:- start:170 stop:1039 length:870 start_codon:yes stop_codon:yes gene_type:complete